MSRMVWALVLWNGTVWLLATMLSVAPDVSLWGSPTWGGGLLVTFAHLIVFVAAADLLAKEKHLRWAADVCVWGSVPVCTYALLQCLGGDPLTWNRVYLGPLGLYRPFSTLGNPNILGGYIAMLIPVTTAKVQLAKQSRESIPCIIILTMQFVTLLATMSRGSWLAAVAGVAALAVAAREKRRLALLSMAMFVVLLAVVMVRYRPLRKVEWARPQIWKCALSLIMKRPVLGYGPENFSAALAENDLSPPACVQSLTKMRFDHAHNLWLDTAIETGFLGLASEIALLGVSLCGVVARLRETPVSDARALLGSLAGALVSYVVQMQFMFPTVVPTTFFWVFCGMCLGYTKRVPPVPPQLPDHITEAHLKHGSCHYGGA